MATMDVEVVSAEQRLFEGEANEVYARSLDGELGVLPGHQPALMALDVAPVKIHLADGGEERVAVHHGFLYFRDNRLVILADMADMAGDIDPQRQREELERLERDAEAGDEEAELARRRAEVRLDVAESMERYD